MPRQRHQANDPGGSHVIPRMTCCQVALSTLNLGQSLDWYQALGFSLAGERRHCEGPLYAAVPGLPEASFDVQCLVGSHDFFQIEVFEFSKPQPKPLTAAWRPCDIGYSMIGIQVPDLERALRTLRSFGETPVGTIPGQLGTRRVRVTDPDGILVELTERPARIAEDFACGDSRISPTVVSVTLSVPNLRRASRFWIDALRCSESSVTDELERSSHWRLGGTPGESMVLDAGAIIIELVEFRSPAGKPRPNGYMLSDQGVLNVAFGSIDIRTFNETYRRATEYGYRGHTEPWTMAGVATVVYFADEDACSVELLHVDPAALGRMGFLPNPRQKVATP